MRSPDPIDGVPTGTRYPSGLEEGRYRELRGKGDAGTYNYRPSTLEEEAYFGGWLPGARPTGDGPLNDLMTIGMRGEPGWDDDPQFNNGSATVTHPPAKGSIAGSDD
jgi:hypothetical protein